MRGESVKGTVKVAVKKLLRSGMQKNTAQIMQEIDIKSVVSFDVFDTLIKRSVEKPEDIFDLVEKEYNIKASVPIHGFKKMRMEAETAARKQSCREEVTLSEIYQMLDSDGEVREQLMNTERETEFINASANPKGMELYNYCIRAGKKIIIVSDMYLDKCLITEMLKKNGYADCHEVFVSSEYGVKKKTGRLYKKVLAETGLSPKQILHIGDNPVSDGISAHREGIEGWIL